MNDINEKKCATLDMIHTLYIKALAKMGGQDRQIQQVCDEIIAHDQAPDNYEGHSAIVDWYARKYPIDNPSQRKIIWDCLAKKLLVPDAPRVFVVHIHQGRPFIWDPRTLDILYMVSFLDCDGENDILLHFNPTYPPADRLMRSTSDYLLQKLADGLSLDPFDRNVYRARIIREQKILPPEEARELEHDAFVQHDEAHRAKAKYGSK